MFQNFVTGLMLLEVMSKFKYSETLIEPVHYKKLLVNSQFIWI